MRRIHLLCLPLLLATAFFITIIGVKTAAAAQQPRSVIPPTSWCQSSTYTIPPSAYDTVCIEKSGSQLNTSSALSAQVSSGWRSCTTRLNIYDGTTGQVKYGSWISCGSTPSAGFSGPAMTAQSGHQYRAWADIKMVYIFTTYTWSAYSTWASI